MKILYKIPDDVIDGDEINALDSLFENAPPEYKETAQKLIDAYKGMRIELTIYYMDMSKYQLMWSLRSIEEEINNEGKTIMILEDLSVDSTAFSPEVSVKIQQLIKQKM